LASHGGDEQNAITLSPPISGSTRCPLSLDSPRRTEAGQYIRSILAKWLYKLGEIDLRGQLGVVEKNKLGILLIPAF
jgi:hypothetical protein